MAAPTIQPNAYVVIDYTLRDDDGDILDASEGEGGEPIVYVHGYGMLVPGLEAALAGLAAGDEREVIVPAATGYGERDEDLVLEIDRSEFPDPAKVKVGDEFIAESPDGDEIAMEVVEIKDDVVVVDANHPLAGMTLHYKVSVRSVRDATDVEIHAAASELEEAQGHVHGEGCDHDHDHDHAHAHGDAHAHPHGADETPEHAKSQVPDVASIGNKNKKKTTPDLLN
jgi:FKBP-type peptidyl-prolyl cis-trans isomerase SlyD